MNICELIRQYAKLDSIAHEYRDSVMSYKDLEERSNSLAVFLIEEYEDNYPIVVYGHKEHLMLVSFLGCIKSGHAYIPIDSSMPEERVKDIVDNSKAKVILNIAGKELDIKDCSIFNGEKIDQIMLSYSQKVPDEKYRVSDEDIHYIIYTSGSTGKPKGVKITSNCLQSFVEWIRKYSEEFEGKEPLVVMNQAPFSFDLSVMDLYLALSTGSVLYSVDKGMIGNLKELFQYFKSSNINVWVSTPSFAEMCLADSSFNSELLPGLKLMLFCGETLTNNCVKRLHERFEGVKVINLYGPTEATVAVTAIEVDSGLCERENPLPVGYIKENCEIFIVEKDDNTLNTEAEYLKFDGTNYRILKEEERGEIIISGKSVSPGYLNNEEVTKKVFSQSTKNGENIRYYKTGDEGYLKNGVLYYNGRIDFQVKLNGFRIELEDIESNLLGIDFVDNAVVLPVMKDGKLYYLAAVVTLNKKFQEKDFAISVMIKNKLKERLPEYMVPRKIAIKERLPMTTNGKIDRKLLLEELK